MIALPTGALAPWRPSHAGAGHAPHPVILKRVKCGVLSTSKSMGIVSGGREPPEGD